MTLSDLNYLLKAQSSNTVTLGVRASVYGVEEDTVSPLQIVYFDWLLLFSHSIMSSSLQPNGLQHARLPCPLLPLEFSQTHSTQSVMPSSHLIHCHLLLLLNSIFPSMRVFSNESALQIRWPKLLELQHQSFQ